MNLQQTPPVHWVPSIFYIHHLPPTKPPVALLKTTTPATWSSPHGLHDGLIVSVVGIINGLFVYAPQVIQKVE